MQLEEVTTAELAWITQLMGVLDEAWSAYYPDSAIRNLFGLSSMASPQLPVREPDIEAGHEEPAHQQGQGQHGEAGGGGSPVAAMRRRAWARAGRVWQPVQTAVADAPTWKVRLLNSDCRSKTQADSLAQVVAGTCVVGVVAAGAAWVYAGRPSLGDLMGSGKGQRAHSTVVAAGGATAQPPAPGSRMPQLFGGSRPGME